MKASVMRNTGCNRRVAPPISLPSTLEDPATWKGGEGGGSFGAGGAGGGGGGFGGGGGGGGGFGGGFQGAGSPAGAPYPGSTTPQYTASPAPSGSSTPGPPQPPPQAYPPSSGPPYNGPGGPFGSPGGGGQFGGRPSSSGPPFGPPGPPPGNPHPFGAQPFPGHQFGVPPGSPFGPMAPGPMGPGGHPMMPGPPGPGPVDRIDQGCVPVPRRHTPYFGQPDYRIYELNKRLQQRTDESDNLWWDAFATEFFEDDATLTLTFCLEDGPKRYTIGRTLIPRYFRSIFEGGVSDLYYILKHPKESFHNTSITLDCEQCTMVTHHGKPMFTKCDVDVEVWTEGRLILEFTFDDLMRIKSWHFSVRSHRELLPRSALASLHSQQDPQLVEQMSKNITRQGITNSTLNYLRLCVILEPMQELMSRHKAYALSPRDCLKTTLFQKWQRMVAPPDSQRPANKRRKRKSSTASGPASNTPPAPNKKRSPGPNFSLASQDVMVVGEPSLMGGEFGDEDERLITRLENTQYDPSSNSLGEHDAGGYSDSPLGGGWGPAPPSGPPQDNQGGPSGPPSAPPGGPPGGPGSQPPGGPPPPQQQDKKSPAVGVSQ